MSSVGLGLVGPDPIDLSAMPGGDVIPGPARREVSTAAEAEVKQMKYARDMAQQWIGVLQKRAGGQMTQQQTAYLVQHLVPILVEALGELLRVHESEARALHQHAKKLRYDPSMKPMNQLQPLEWLASYLVRHNPKHVTNTNPLTLIYAKAIADAQAAEEKKGS